MTDEPPVIRFTAVGLTYPGPPAVPALRPCDLVIRRGEYVAVVGPSGSGKSTFMNVLGLLDRPTTGVYELDGLNCATLRERDRTAVRGNRIGLVFQAFHLLPHRTAVENVVLAQLYNGSPRRERVERAVALLRRVGLGARLDALPSTMSGGERQRVAFARALVNRPRLLLCDEPTGNLDSATAASMLALISDLHQEGQTIVVITHDKTVADRAQRIVAIRDGILTSGELVGG